MSLFGKLFGKRQEASQPPPLKPLPVSPPPEGAPKMMKVWDAYGRVGEIPREEWRTKVLPINFQNAWNKPDELANLINVTLNDGFISECLEPARQLYRTDPDPKRAANILSFVLIKLNKLDEAERILTEAIKKHGRDSLFFNNLAKVHFGRGDAAAVDRALWDSLELDPNLENSFGWYVANHRERSGEEDAMEATRRVAALPGSWRPQLWLARAALQSRQLDQALILYREAIDRAGKPSPTHLLQQISGDLGNAAHLPEILQLVEPHFDPKFHGLLVGNNLIKAHVDLGQLDAARRILDQLYAQNRGDWKEHLNFWENEIAKARIAVSGGREEPLKFAMLAIDGPVWLKPESPAVELFPARTSENVRIAFLGSCAEIATNSKRVQHQLANAPGRMSRALPLFLAEQVAFNSHARVQTLVPWIASDPPGFVFAGGPWKDEDAANHSRHGELKSDYVVVVYIKANAEQWTAELRLVRSIDGKCLGEVTGGWPSTDPESGVRELVRRLLALLAEQAELSVSDPPPIYQVPAARHFGEYLLRLEQLLAVRCAGMDAVSKAFLNGEREIIDGNLQLCLGHPQNVGVRILLAQTVAGMKRARPDILPEYKEKLALLQKEKPLGEPAQAVVQRIFNEALTV